MEVYAKKSAGSPGAAGAGQIPRECNQIAIAGLVQAEQRSYHLRSEGRLDGRDVGRGDQQVAAGRLQMAKRIRDDAW